MWPFRNIFFGLNSAYLIEIFLLQNLFVGWSRSGALASHLDAHQFVSGDGSQDEFEDHLGLDIVQAPWFHTVGVIMWTSDLYVYIYMYFYTHSFFKVCTIYTINLKKPNPFSLSKRYCGDSTARFGGVIWFHHHNKSFLLPRRIVEGHSRQRRFGRNKTRIGLWMFHTVSIPLLRLRKITWNGRTFLCKMLPGATCGDSQPP